MLASVTVRALRQPETFVSGGRHMGRLFTAALVAGFFALALAGFASSSKAATLSIDFGCNGTFTGQCTSGDAPLQSG